MSLSTLPEARTTKGAPSAEFVLMALASAILVAATYLIEFREFSMGPHSTPKLFQQFDLGQENNLAAWFSGALLALIGLHAMDGHTLFRSVSPRVARAWVLIAGVLFFFSADEVGSLHERLSVVGKSIGVGSWGLLLPLGAVLALTLLWAIAALWREGGTQRMQGLFLMAGFGLLGSVAIQEFLEHTLTWNGAHANAARVAIEEGSELLGMLILLGAVLNNSNELLAGGNGRHGTIFEMLTQRRRGLFTMLIVAAPAIALLNTGLDQRRGQPADWLAAMAFLAAAAVVMSAWLKGRSSYAIFLVAGLLLVLSCTCVAISATGILETSVMTTTHRAALLVLMTIIVLAVSYRSGLLQVSYLRLAALAGISVALLTLSDSRALAFFLTIVLGAMVYFEMSLVQKTEPTIDRNSAASL